MKKIFTTFLASAIVSISFGQVFNKVADAGLIDMNWSSGASADINSDGKMDVIIVGHEWTSGSEGVRSFVVGFGNGDGTFSAQDQTKSNGIPGFSRAVIVDVADFDNDGDVDFVAGGNANGGILPHDRATRLFLNDGTGKYTLAEGFPASTFDEKMSSVKALDYNNDGLMDVVVLCWGTFSGSDDVESYLVKNQGGGNFELVSDFSANSGFWDALAQPADFDNDGDIDIIGMGWMERTNDTDVLFKNEGGSFSQNNYIGISSAGNSAPPGGGDKTGYIADINSDGNLDFLLNSAIPYGTNHTLWSTGNGDGTFTAQALDLFSTTNLAHIAVGDLNQDGKTDFGKSNNLGFYAGNGDGSFTEDYSMPGDVVNHQFGLLVGDFNNDKALDLVGLGVVGNNSPGLTSVYLNSGSKANQAPAAPQNLKQTINGTSITLSWDKATDDNTPVASLSYNVYLAPKTGGNYIVSPLADTETGLRKVASIGNAQLRTSITINGIDPAAEYVWGVQTIDASLTGSAFATYGPTTGIAANKSVSFSAFPNPASNMVSLIGISNASSIQLIGLNGQLVKSFEVNSKQLNISDINKGVYFIKVITKQGVGIQKLVIQ